jgi:hypothetical protein
VKIFGERNVGTNALAQMISDNSQCRLLPSTEYQIDPAASRQAWAQTDPWHRERLLDLIYAGATIPKSWKHTATNFDDPAPFEQTLVLFCVKHPASWFASLYRNPYHLLGAMPEDIADFIDFQWKTTARERLGEGSFKPLELYNAKVHSYLEFAKVLESAGMKFTFIRQEDLLLNQKQVFRSLAPELVGRRGRFRKRLRSAKNGFMPLFLVKRYYRAKRWKDLLRGLEGAVNRKVDWGPLKQFGYEQL